MSTDLFGESELGASDTDFEWDAFVPDSDEPESLSLESEEDELDWAGEDEDEIESDVDEREFAWDSVLAADDDSAEGEAAQLDASRLEAAFTRMEHTVQSTFGPEPETEPWPDTEAEAEPELVLLSDGELASSAARVPEAEFRGQHEPEPELVLLDDLEPEDSEHQDSEHQDSEPQDSEPGDSRLGNSELELTTIDAPVHEPERGLVGDRDDTIEVAFVDWNLEMTEDAELELLNQHEPELELVDDREPAFVDRGSDVADTAPPEPADADANAPTTHAAFATALGSDASELSDDPDVAPAPATEPEGPAGLSDARSGAGRERPRRVRTATVVLMAVILIAAAGVGVALARHHSTAPTAPPAAVTAPPHHTPATTPAATAAAARMQTATAEAVSATTTATAGLSALPGFPTPTNVAAVVNPYVASLELYESFLSGADVPASAHAAAATASTQIHDELTFLATINGLPPIQLGTFIRQFQADSAALQGTLTTIQHALPASASS